MSWSTGLLEPNSKAKVTVETVGASKQRVVVVDDFYANPERLLSFADGLHFVGGKMHGNFPGGRAMVSIDTDPLVEHLGRLWGAPLEPYTPPQALIFSVIFNDPNRRLNVAQRMPHVDPGVSAMVWLNPQEMCAGGTGLYRHKPTGLERLPTEPTRELEALAQTLDIPAKSLHTPEGWQSFQDHIVFNPLFAARENTYINDGNEAWELLHLMQMRWNRLVIFDGRMFHSQHLKPGHFVDHARINQILYLKARGS